MPNILCPVLDARKSEVYFTLYRGGEEFNKITDYQCASVDELLEKVVDFSGDIIFLGEGIFKYQNKVKNIFGSRAIILHPIISNIKASNVAFLGLQNLEKGKICDASTITPFYIRKSEAETAWEKRIDKV